MDGSEMKSLLNRLVTRWRRHTGGEPESNQVKFARSELALLGLTPDAPDGPDRWMAENVLELVTVFARQGHSGASARYCQGMLTRLLRFEPLTPLTGSPAEWGDPGLAGVWLNKRYSCVFMDPAGRAYDSCGRIFRTPGGGCYTSIRSRVTVTFPYLPKTKYVEVAE